MDVERNLGFLVGKDAYSQEESEERENLMALSKNHLKGEAVIFPYSIRDRVVESKVGGVGLVFFFFLQNVLLFYLKYSTDQPNHTSLRCTRRSAVCLPPDHSFPIHFSICIMRFC